MCKVYGRSGCSHPENKFANGNKEDLAPYLPSCFHAQTHALNPPLSPCYALTSRSPPRPRLVPWALGDRQRLAGERRLVHGRTAGGDHAVRRQLGTRKHLEQWNTAGEHTGTAGCVGGGACGMGKDGEGWGACGCSGGMNDRSGHRCSTSVHWNV